MTMRHLMFALSMLAGLAPVQAVADPVVKSFSGGLPPKSEPCEAFAPHGFYGLELAGRLALEYGRVGKGGSTAFPYGKDSRARAHASCIEAYSARTRGHGARWAVPYREPVPAPLPTLRSD